MGLAHLSRGKMCFNTFELSTDTWKIILNVRCEDTALFCMFALNSDYISAPAGLCGVGFVSVVVETLCSHSPPDSQKAENREEGECFTAKAAGIHEAFQRTFCSSFLLCGYFFIR